MSEPEPPSRNRRRTLRRKATRRARVACHAGPFGFGPNLALSLLDVSESGACVLLSAPLEPGKEVEVHLTGPGQVRGLRVAATVTWCRAADGGHCAGLEFHRSLRYADMLQLC
jgi:hypothetical protein